MRVADERSIVTLFSLNLVCFNTKSAEWFREHPTWMAQPPWLAVAHCRPSVSSWAHANHMNFGLPYATLVSIAPTQNRTHMAYIVQESETSKP